MEWRDDPGTPHANALLLSGLLSRLARAPGPTSFLVPQTLNLHAHASSVALLHSHSEGFPFLQELSVCLLSLVSLCFGLPLLLRLFWFRFLR